MQTSLVPSIYVLDAYNKKLIRALDEDGRMPLARIAKKIGLSREAVSARYSKLLEDGVLVRFGAIIDYFALGYKCYCLILNLQNVGGDARDSIVAYLRRVPHVSVQAYMLSNWDLEITIWVKDDAAFARFYDSFILAYSDVILTKKIFVVTGVSCYSHAYLHDGSHSVSIGRGSKRRSMDETDATLLGLLEKDPRADLVSMARRLDIAATTVAYRVQRLRRENILVGCVPKLELSKIGYYKYRIEVSLNDPAQKSKVASYLASNEHILRVMDLVGDMDLAFEGDFRGPIRVDAFLTKLKEAVPLIRNFDVRAIVRQ